MSGENFIYSHAIKRSLRALDPFFVKNNHGTILDADTTTKNDVPETDVTVFLSKQNFQKSAESVLT